MRFPNSARATWLAGTAKRTRAPRVVPRPEEQERRALARELARLLPDATRAQLLQVVRSLGLSQRWVELVCIEGKHPGAVGRAILRATR